MKKLVLALMIALFLFGSAAMAEDVVSSASVSDSFAQFALTGDDLMNAINSFTGTYLVSTTNPDGTPNTAFFVFSLIKYEDAYYLQLGLAPNQSMNNLNANGEGLAIYAANAAADAASQLIVSGARIYFEAIADENVLAELLKDARQGAMFFEIVAVRPLG